MPTVFAASFIIILMSDDIGLDLVEKRICVVAVSGELDGLEKVEGENTHDRLRVNDITSGHEVDIHIILGYDIYKVAYILDGGELDIYCFHL